MIKIFNDVPENWNLGFQEESTPIAAGIIDFHNTTMYYLFIIFIIVSYFIIVRLSNKNFLSRIKYFNHLTTRWIEFLWTILPAIILIFIAVPSFKLLYSLESEEFINPLLTVKVTGNQWYWNYELSDIEGLNINFDSYTKSLEDLNVGEFRLLDVDNRLFLPIHTPIRFLITSQDVIHSFFVPSLGVKLDAVPGRLNYFNLYLLRNGTWGGFCAEICGPNHSQMSIVVEGVEKSQFTKWLASFLE